MYPEEWDAATSRDVESVLNPLIDGGSRKLVFNGQNLSYISSSGLEGAILASLKRLRQDGGDGFSLAPCRLGSHYMTGFDRIFTICETPEQAISRITS